MAKPKRDSEAGHKLSEKFADPDLVDRVFDYVVELLPELGGTPERIDEVKQAVRDEFAGEKAWVRSERRKQASRDLARQVLSLFNGRNASEVARRLNIERPSVYRILKRAGKSEV